MHLLCKHGEDWHEWYALSAHPDAEPLEAKAAAMNTEEYAREYAEWIAMGKVGPYPLPLDDPKREGYCTYFVASVEDWPVVAEDQP